MITFLGNLIGFIIVDLISGYIVNGVASIFTKNKIIKISVTGIIPLLLSIMLLLQNDFDEYVKRSSVVVNIIMIIGVVALAIYEEKKILNSEKEKQHKTITEDDLKKQT